MESKSVLEKVINIADAHKVSGCDVILNEGKSFSTSVQNNDVDKYEVSGSKILGIRVIKDQKIGLSYTEDFSDQSLEIVVKKAIENSQFSKINENEVISNNEKSEVDHINTKTKDVRANELIELNKSLESEMKKLDSRIAAVPYNGVSESESKSYYMNSNGRLCIEEDYSLSCYTSALIKEGEKNSLHYQGAVAREFDKLDYKKCIDESFYHAKEWLNAAPIKSGKYPVVFSTDQLQSMFGAFHSIYSAKARYEKSNPMAESLNKEIFSKLLTITDSPNYHEALFHDPFDSEGFTRDDLVLIENGVFKNFFHNSVTSKQFKEENNFRASRGARSSLSVSGTHTVISTGDSSQADIETGEYLKIFSMQGLHSGLNFMSGDFSFGASGYLMKNGEVQQAVNGITVAGNFYKMLKEIDCIGNEMKANSSTSFFSPDMRFAQLTIAGN